MPVSNVLWCLDVFKLVQPFTQNGLLAWVKVFRIISELGRL